MDIVCPRCLARHQVEPPAADRQRARPLRFRCSECGNTFPLGGESAAPPPPSTLTIEPPSRLVPEPRPMGVAEPVEMLRVGGEVYGVPDTATLQRWILEQRVSPLDMVSQHGMPWSAIGDRAEFAMFFRAAEFLGADRPAEAPVPDAPPAWPSAGRGLHMAADEHLYVHEVPVGGSDSLPLGLGPPPTAAEGLPQTSSPTLDPHPFLDDPTIQGMGPPPLVGPLDELPAALLLAPPLDDDPTQLLHTPPSVPFALHARSLGYKLEPDPDTAEETIQDYERQEAAAVHDPTENFMLSGVIPGTADYTVPALEVGDSVPATIRQRQVWSALDDDLPAPPRRRGAGPEMIIGGLFVGAAVVALAGWMFTRPADEPAAADPAAVVAAEPTAPPAEPPPPPLASNPADDAARAAAQAEAMEEPLPDLEAAPPEPVAVAEPVAPKAAPVAKVAEPVAPKAAPVAKVAEPVAPKAAPVAKVAEPKAAPVAKVAKVAEPSSGGSARSLTDAGWKAIDKGDLQGAHGLFGRALQKDAGSAWALYGRGYANEKLGDKVSAASDYCSAQSRAGGDTELARELSSGLRRVAAGC